MKKSIHIYMIIILLALIQVASLVHAQQPIKKSKQTETVNGIKFYIHTVEKGQTLYSISKAYGTTVNIIVANNQEVLDGLKIGNKIKIPYINNAVITTIPATKEDKKSKISSEKKSKKDSSAVTQKASLPITTEPTITNEVIKPIGDIHVGLFLPLSLSSEENLDLNNEKINDETKIGIEFYEGFKLAFDSLKKNGFKGYIHVYDSDTDSITLENLLRKSEVKDLDMIIGPLYGKRFDRIQKFAKENNINIVSPTIQANHILMGNTHVSKVTPSYITQSETLAKYIAEKFIGNNIIVFNSANAKDRPYINSFKKAANEILTKLNLDTVKEMTFTTMPTFMSQTKANIIAIPSTNQSFITEAINKLFLHKQENLQQNTPDSILIFGLSNWQDIESLDFGYLKTLYGTISSYSFIDYSNPKTKKFILNYRNLYKTEPTEYVYLGFDVGYYYLDGLQKYGNELQRKLPKLHYKGIQTEFNFIQSDINSGYENTAVGIMKFNNYSYIRLK